MVNIFVLVLSLAAGVAPSDLIDEDDGSKPSCPKLHELRLQSQEMAGVLLGICR